MRFLGIRANVSVIYEPPQESSRDSVHLLKDEREELVNQIGAALGIRRIGWIFTDLLPEDVQKGTVKHTRNATSHFLTAQECIMAGHFQNLQPNPSKFATSGTYGSKFVTVCVTGMKYQIRLNRKILMFFNYRRQKQSSSYGRVSSIKPMHGFSSR